MAAISSLVISFFLDNCIEQAAPLAFSKLIVSSGTIASSVELLAQVLVCDKMISSCGVLRNFLRTMLNQFWDICAVLREFSFFLELGTKLLSDKNPRLACQISLLVYMPSHY